MVADTVHPMVPLGYEAGVKARIEELELMRGDVVAYRGHETCRL